MTSNYRISLETAFALMSEIEGFDEYLDKEIKTLNPGNLEDFISVIETYENQLRLDSNLSEKDFFILKNAKEVCTKYFSLNSNSKISFINKTLAPKEGFIKGFLSDFNEARTDDLVTEEVKPKKYKTKTEINAFYGVDEKKLNIIYERYREYNHPFIYYTIAEPKINAKDFSFGVTILNKALRYAFRYPNFYWNSKYGVEACAWSLFQVQYVLGYRGISKIEERIPSFITILLKLIYLYLSRYIYMSKNDIKSIDFYAHRARFVKDYESIFSVIFGIGANPDIQYISDYFLAYQVSVEHNLAAIPAFKQHLWESSKMYQHGSHIPNGSGGYQDIEDRTWMELVSDGAKRSIMFSEKFLAEFEDSKLNLTNDQIDFVCQVAIDMNEISGK